MKKYPNTPEDRSILSDAYFFKALYCVMLNQVDEALDCLNKILAESYHKDKLIYIFTFYWGQLLSEDIIDINDVKKVIVNKNIDASKLTQSTMQYLIQHKGEDFRNLNNLNKFSNFLIGLNDIAL